ncbi:MAG: hypothetical protein AB1861_17645 [Cyanobacteriota bacterium]
MFGNPASSQSVELTNRFKCSISLLLLPLPTAGCGSEEKPRVDIGRFNFDPGLQEGDWVHINNLVEPGKFYKIKAQVKERKVTLTWLGHADKSILEIEIYLEAEDRDLLLRLTEDIDSSVARKINPE